jgi:hypothetical protein
LCTGWLWNNGRQGGWAIVVFPFTLSKQRTGSFVYDALYFNIEVLFFPVFTKTTFFSGKRTVFERAGGSTSCGTAYFVLHGGVAA